MNNSRSDPGSPALASSMKPDVTKATLVTSQVGRVGIARSQGDIRLSWLSVQQLGGPSRLSFTSSSVLCWAHSDSWAGSGCRHGTEKSPGSLVRQDISLSPMAATIPSMGYRRDWNKCAGKRKSAKKMHIVSNKVKGWTFRPARGPVTFHRGLSFYLSTCYLL